MKPYSDSDINKVLLLRRIFEDYLECAAWVNAEDNEYELPEQIKLAQEVSKFIRLCNRKGIDLESLPPSVSVGHDLYLTRNRHGTGFWARGLGEIGDTLTAIAQTLGESE